MLLLFIGAQLSMAQTILVMGDSLSAGYGIELDQSWPSLLQKQLKEQTPQWQVVNLSISGETTAGGLHRLPAALDKHQPDIVILELGANDGLRGLSPLQMRQNLQRMIQLSQQQGDKVLLVGMHLPPNYGAIYTRQFDQAFTTLATQFKLPFMPFLLQDVASDPLLMQSDNLHPTAPAQPIILANLWHYLQPLLEDETAIAP